MGLSSLANAGAPDAVGSDLTEQADTRTTLSPAELRNAVSVKLDQLAQQGVDIDRTPFDGIGLVSTQETFDMERFSGLNAPMPYLANRAP